MNVSKAANVVKEAMEAQNVTYRDLGEYVGVSHVQCWRMLNGTKTFKEKYMEKMAEFLGLDLAVCVEPDPVITVRMPARFMDWIVDRAADTQTDVDTIIVNAVAAWIKLDVNGVKLQSHENAKVIKKRGRPKKN